LCTQPIRLFLQYTVHNNTVYSVSRCVNHLARSYVGDKMKQSKLKQLEMVVIDSVYC